MWRRQHMIHLICWTFLGVLVFISLYTHARDGNALRLSITLPETLRFSRMSPTWFAFSPAGKCGNDLSHDQWANKTAKFLALDWPFHLGFNNLRFIIEEGIYLANLLDRHLLLPPSLKMRTCTNDTMCKVSGCTAQSDSTYWCPLSHFLSVNVLQSAGATVINNLAEFEEGKSIKNVEDAFSDLYSPSTLSLDKIPDHILPYLNGSNYYTKSSALHFPYWDYRRGCEMSYFEIRRHVWSSWDNRNVRILGFTEMYGSMDEDILHLHGAPHDIYHTPVLWHSFAAQAQSKRLIDKGIRYNHAVHSYADLLSSILKNESKTAQYMAVHLRRGDFVTQGWLGSGRNLSVVLSNILNVRDRNEVIYMATNEENTTLLDMYRMHGVRMWDDYANTLKRSGVGKLLSPMLGFQDFVGLIEQLVCAQARAFMGTHCSSVTGGILNFRRNMLGDNSFLKTVEHL
eukprot:m.21409 g.21409  ORF g.21409 m.21409 type:complete len:456 (+) comp12412_c0_seq2:57-1424(+)